MRPMKSKRKKRGRPPAGIGGASVKDYPRLTVRLPPETMRRLRAWNELEREAGDDGRTARPIWRLIDDAVNDAISRLPAARRRRIQ
jgi:hypothetical protein